jgi:hypothetical protein
MSNDDRLDDASADDAEEQRERYRELLEETRTVMPGTQVLFAFLLTAAFSESFKDLDLLAKRAYAGALLLAAVAAITLMAPTAFHRISDPGTRAARLRVSTKLQVAGMALLLASMTLVTFVVGRLIFNDTAVGFLFGGTTAATGVALWYLLPQAGSRARA